MKWTRRVLAALAVLILAAVGFSMLTAPGGKRPVGFQVTHSAGPDGKPFMIGVWYPTSARPWPTTLVGLTLLDVAKDGPVAGASLPLIVISHGNGAGVLAHVDLALALAGAGYVVAAPMHDGDNFMDQRGVGSPTFFNTRSEQFRATTDHMLKAWAGSPHIDASQVGAFGFSMGGFTVQTAVGAQPDLRLIASHCAKAKEFACDVLRHFQSPYAGPRPKAGQPFVPDPRIKAAVLAAPGMGFAMGEQALANVHVPLQLWVGEKDDKVSDAGPVGRLVGGKVESHKVQGAGHLSFLAPCSGLLRPPEVCAEAGGFDRAAFHATMNAGVLAFFDSNLRHR